LKILIGPRVSGTAHST